MQAGRREETKWGGRAKPPLGGSKVYTGLNQMGPNHGVEKFISVTHVFFSSPFSFFSFFLSFSSSPCFFTEPPPGFPPVNEFGYRYRFRWEKVCRSHRNSPSKFCIKGNGIQARLTGVSHHKTTFFILKHKHIDSFVQLVLSYMTFTWFQDMHLPK